MIKKKILTSLFFTGLVLAGCQSSSEPKVYALGDQAAAGEFVYQVDLAEKLSAIPSANTIPEYQVISADLPAKEGYTWVHLKGLITNSTEEPAVLWEDKLSVVDGNGDSYRAAVETSMYVEAEQSVFYIVVEPANSAGWEAYFEVPVEATDLQLYGYELGYAPGSKDPQAWVSIDLGL